MLDPIESKETSTEVEVNEVVSNLDREAQLRLEVIQALLEPCDRLTYGKKYS